MSASRLGLDRAGDPARHPAGPLRETEPRSAGAAELTRSWPRLACALLVLAAAGSLSHWAFRAGVAASAQGALQASLINRERVLLPRTRAALADLLVTSDDDVRRRVAQRLRVVAAEVERSLSAHARVVAPAGRVILFEAPHRLAVRVPARMRELSRLAEEQPVDELAWRAHAVAALDRVRTEDAAIDGALARLGDALATQAETDVGAYARLAAIGWIGALLAVAVLGLQVLLPTTRRLARKVEELRSANGALDAHERELHAALAELARSRDEARDRASAILGVMEDLERERSRMADEVRQRAAAEDRFRTVFESAPSGLLVVDERGVIVLVNSHVERLLGYTRPELVGAPLERLVPDRWAPVHAELRRRFFEAPSARPMGAGRDLHVRRKDGIEVPVEIGLNPILTPTGPVVLASLVDITERKRSETAIARANDELRRKNEEMEQFVYTVSHDLKSPIVTILGFSGHIVTRVERLGDAQVVDAAQRVVRASSRLREIIDDLLDLSRVGRVRLERTTVDVGALVAEVLEEHASEIALLAADVVVDPALGTVCGDATRLREVFDNLLQNALRYGCTAADARIAIGRADTGDEIRYFVADHGPGIPIEAHERVFGLFQRLTSDRRGTGVGLTLVKRVVELHCGRVWVESPPRDRAHGTTIWLALPIGVAEEAAA